jgi:hypothetical protein
MFLTSTECRAIAENKLAEAGRDKRHRKRLTTAAEGWLFLAIQLGCLEESFEPDDPHLDVKLASKSCN